MKIDLHPLFRFSEFEVSWNLRSLGELYDIDAGYAFKRSDYIDIGIPLINGESIKNGNISNKNLNFLPTNFKEKYKKYILKTDDIVIALNRPIINGSLKISQIPTYLDGSFLYQRAGRVINFSKLDIDFSYQLLTKEVTKFVLKEAVGSDQPFISTTKLKNWLLVTPNQLEEQKKIGSFFKNLDETILLHQQELDALKQTKKGFLQKMFPSEGQSVPEIRFKEFKDVWSNYKLNEISEKVKEKNVDNVYSETLTNSAEFGIINQRDFFDKDISNKLNLFTYYVVQPDDFVYNPRISKLAPVGPIKRNKLGRVGVMSPLYYVFRIRNLDLTYLEYYFSTEKWHMFMKLNGDSGARSDRISIKDSILNEMPIPLPSSIEEQLKIGKFFKQLDEVIKLKEQELEALKQTKKGFLQKMFV